MNNIDNTEKNCLDPNSRVVAGRNSVIELMKSGRQIDKILIKKGDMEGSLVRIAAMAKERSLSVVYAESEALDYAADIKSHQGVVAMCACKEYVSVDDILAFAKSKNEPPFIVIADGIEDPYNLGAVIRSAEAAGAHGVIIPKKRAVGLTPSVAKSSAGAVEYMNIAKVTNISVTVEDLKKAGVWVYAADANADKYYYDADLKGAVAIVVGGEGKGVRRLVRESCDGVMKIPMSGNVTSLNVSAAAAIVLFEAVRQRIKTSDGK